MKEKRLKIGLFNDTFFPMVDGVVMVVDNYARRLSKFCDVVVFVPAGRSDFDDSTLPYKVVRCNSKFPVVFLDYDLPMPSSDAKFMKQLKNEQLDLVHIHSPFSIGKLGVRYAKKHNIPVIATMHSQFEQDFYRATKSKLITKSLLKGIMKVFNSCTECWAVNDEIARIFKRYGAYTLPETQNNGTDLLPYENNEEIKLLKEKYNIKNDEKVLLFIGRLTALKNIFFIADSLRLLKERGFKFKMLYVGTGTDEEKLKSHIKKLGIQDNVILTGKVIGREEISKYYKMADLFMFPSLYDASSLVQIEAASQSTPTIFLRGAATAATVTEDVNGYIAENSVDAFASKIEEIFADEAKYNTICQNAFNDLYVHWDKAVEKSYKDYLRVKTNFTGHSKVKIKKEKSSHRALKVKGV